MTRSGHVRTRNAAACIVSRIIRIDETELYQSSGILCTRYSRTVYRRIRNAAVQNYRSLDEGCPEGGGRSMSRGSGGGRGYVGQFSRNSMGRDRHSNSRYLRPPSLEAGACSNKPQTPYPGPRIHHRPLSIPPPPPAAIFRVSFPVPAEFPFHSNRYLSVSLPITILSLLRARIHGRHSNAGAAITIQISYPPP